MGAQTVINDDIGLIPADAVKIQVHDAKPGGLCHVIPTEERPVLKVVQLALIHAWIAADDVVVSGQEETAGATSRVTDGGVWLRDA